MRQIKLKLDSDLNKNKYFVAFSHLAINAPLFKAKLFEFFDYDIIRTFSVDKNDLNEFAKTYENVTIPRSFLQDLKSIDIERIFEKVNSKGVKYFTYDDPCYPEALKMIEDFPLLLYYKGNFDNINFDRTLAIVGSRKATQSALVNVSNIVSGLSDTDVVIVSGLAAGIDTMAHKSAIQNNLKTIGVIGSGFNYIYPVFNKDLYKQIEEGKGLILSEYPNELRPVSFNFPQRNRIVTGLSKGVLIAEAKLKSGAMISARMALEQGREVMCIPGLIANPNCEGIYHLIKNGAPVVTNAEDILNNLGWDIQVSKQEKVKLSGLEGKIYELISKEEFTIEGLKQNLDVGINELMVKLTKMELDGTIVFKNGLYYIAGR